MQQTNIFIPVLFVDIDETLTTTKSGKTFKQSPDDIKPLPGSQKAITHFANRGYKIFGISNQGGCDTINPATGNLYKNIEATILEIQNTLALYPEIDSIYFCPKIDGSCCVYVAHDALPYIHTIKVSNIKNYRKPDTGVIDLKFRHFEILGFAVDTPQSLVVGDRDEDRQLAINANLPFMWAEDWLFRYGSFV